MRGTVQSGQALQYQCVFGTPLIRQPLRAATFPRGGRLWRVRLTCYSKQSFTVIEMPGAAAPGIGFSIRFLWLLLPLV